MKKLTVFLFGDESKTEQNKYSDAIFERLARSNLTVDQEFCGIWGEIQFNHEECLQAISATVNHFLHSDKSEVYFGCAEKDYHDIMLWIDRDNCEVRVLSCSKFELPA